jgi:hypothetical protein
MKVMVWHLTIIMEKPLPIGLHRVIESSVPFLGGDGYLLIPALKVEIAASAVKNIKVAVDRIRCHLMEAVDCNRQIN